MKNNKTKHLKILLSLLLVACISATSILTFSAVETNTYEADGFTYTLLDDGTAEITGCNDVTADFTIPSTLDGKNVTSIAPRSFESNKVIENLVISEGIKNIGDYSFWQSEKISAISLPDTLETMGSNAFSHLKSLTEITIPKNVKEISDSCFQSCDNVKTLTFEGDIITSIGDMAFTSLAIADLELPSTVTSIGSNSFAHCVNLKSVDIPSNVKTIESGAFYNCNTMTSVTLPEGLKTVEMGAFQNCLSLKEVTVPKSVEEIGKMAFGWWWNSEDWRDYHVEGFVLKGYDGTVAQSYCKEYDVKYESLGEAEIFKISMTTEQKADKSIVCTVTPKYATGEVKYTFIVDGKTANTNGNVFTYTPTESGDHIITCQATDETNKTVSADYSFYLNEDLLIDEPPVPDSYTVYFDNTDKNFTTPYAYYWPKDSSGPITWPGTEMTLVDGNIYSVSVPSENNMIIFSDKGSSQTGNLDIPGNNYIHNGKDWAIYNPVVTEPTTGTTIESTTESTTTSATESTTESTTPSTPGKEKNYTYDDLTKGMAEPADLGDNSFDKDKLAEDISDIEGYTVVVYKYGTGYSLSIFYNGELMMCYDEYPYPDWASIQGQIMNWIDSGFTAKYLKNEKLTPTSQVPTTSTTETTATTPTSATTPTYEIGDVDMSGTVDIGDALLVMKYSTKLATLTDEQLSLADTNFDGTVNVKDATAIQKHIAGIILITKPQ